MCLRTPAVQRASTRTRAVNGGLLDLGVADRQGLLQLLSPLLDLREGEDARQRGVWRRSREEAGVKKTSPHLAVEVAADGLLGPGLVVKRRPPLLFGVPDHVRH